MKRMTHENPELCDAWYRKTRQLLLRQIAIKHYKQIEKYLGESA